MKISIVILLVTAMFQSCKCKTYRLVKVEGDRRIPQDITHDIDANTVTIVVGDVSEYENKIPTVNYHDFDTGETNLTLNYKATLMHSLTNQEVEETAGGRISLFCSDYKTHFMNLSPVYGQTHKRDAAPCDHTCGICMVSYEDAEYGLSTFG